MIQLPVTRNGNSRIKVPVNGTVYTLIYRYNTRNKRLYLSIELSDVPIISGLRLIEFGSPIVNYELVGFSGYQIFVVENLEGTGFATLGNLGLDLEYVLLLMNQEEVEEIFG